LESLGFAPRAREHEQPQRRRIEKVCNQFAWEELSAISEFRAHAFQAAVAKARDLGWIV
jgi:hypothetical protein